MNLIYQDLSYEILGSLFNVYNEIGYGHKEHIYQKAIANTFESRRIPYKEQVKADLVLNNERIGYFFLDFLVYDKIILEIKSRNNFRAADFKQVQTYLQSTNLKLAILATFTPNGVNHRRILNLY